MSFETTMNFLTDAAAFNLTDGLNSPSAKIVMGQPIEAGTGSFALMQPLE
jgi:DNA-directed RNA polymerase I subunit RPA1